MSNPITMPLEFVVTASRPFPLGVTPARQADQFAPDTVNVAVFAPGLTAVDVHHLGQDGQWHRTRLTEKSGGVHHGLVPRFPLGTKVRVPGAGDGRSPDGQPPHAARRRRRAALQRAFRPAAGPLRPGRGQGRRLARVDADAPGLRLGRRPAPQHPVADTVVYEAHVRGLTKLRPDIPRISAAHTPAWRTPSCWTTSRSSA